MKRIEASVAIGPRSQTIVGSAIHLMTPSGEIQVGIDNSGEVYVSTGISAASLAVLPVSSNRIVLLLLRGDAT